MEWFVQPDGEEGRKLVWGAICDNGHEEFAIWLSENSKRETLRRWKAGTQSVQPPKWAEIGNAFAQLAPEGLPALRAAVELAQSSAPGGKLPFYIDTGGVDEEEPPAPERPLPYAEQNSDSYREELFIPVHKFIWLYPEEFRVIDTPAFQRLRLLSQLGMSSIAFPGATHRRFEHVLGAVAVAHRILRAIKHNAAKADDERVREDPRWHYLIAEPLSDDEERFVRLAALLHDIGHLPYGHTIEDELGRLTKHDDRERLQLVLDKTKWFGIDASFVTESDQDATRSLRDVVDTAYDRFIPNAVRVACGEITASDLVQLIILKRSDKVGEEDKGLPLVPAIDGRSTDSKLTRAQVKAIEDSGFRLQAAQDIVGNTICADLLDYLHRDWYHAGKFRDFDERIFQYMEIRRHKNKHEPDKFVVRLSKGDGFRADGISAILDLLECRHQLAEAVLFHKTKLKATAMLERALSLLIGEDQAGRRLFEDWLLNHAEEALLPALASADSGLVSTPDGPARSAGQRLAYAIAIRNLYAALDVVTYNVLRDRAEDISATYFSNAESPRHRSETLIQLEYDFGLPLGSFAMYCPRVKMHHKIAEVKLLVDGKIEMFIDYDDENELSGGHLDAQKNRARSLWRVGLYWDEAAAKRLVWSSEMLKKEDKGDDLVFISEFARYKELIQQVFRDVVLTADKSRSANEIVDNYARQLKNLSCFDAVLRGRSDWGKYKDLPKVAALGEVGKPDVYALGFKTISSEG